MGLEETLIAKQLFQAECACSRHPVGWASVMQGLATFALSVQAACYVSMLPNLLFDR